eukprot:TRINITY_DN222_c0_g1_i31.p1 TRINITY_DN222_c0_g1~~TRINITY_DN222_c0_g1_i31.p1  ORF type:complete len:228 (+),score=37.10 TRINITY_DN222_c0_g1_i31:110-793(+)
MESTYFVAGLLLIGLLIAERCESFYGRCLTKVPLSALFLVVAFGDNFQVISSNSYDLLMTLGLLCGFLGDVLLIGDSSQSFLCGLVVFLLGHVFYFFAFCNLFSGLPKESNEWIVQTCVLLIFVILVHVFYLSPNVPSNFKVHVLAYLVVITAMVFSSFLVWNASQVDPTTRILVLAGSVLFFFSDLGVAREKFVRPTIWNKVFALPAYFIGQFLLENSLHRESIDK